MTKNVKNNCKIILNTKHEWKEIQQYKIMMLKTYNACHLIPLQRVGTISSSYGHWYRIVIFLHICIVVMNLYVYVCV